MNEGEVEALETELLLEAVFRRYGYDFRNYSRAVVCRRLRQFAEKTDCSSIGDLIPAVLRQPALFQSMLLELSITVTQMFRDPSFYRAVRESVIPVLKTYPFIKIWHAGCATGEEAYSMAILLKEEGLLERATIFATDINDHALERARKGIFPLESVRGYTENYHQTGALHSFSSYCHADREAVVMHGDLKNSITFANHNLALDQVFGEMHLIFCRNVLIYFNQELRDRVLQLFDDSLIRGGFLCLGSKEMLCCSCIGSRYEQLGSRNRIYRKRLQVPGNVSRE